MTSIRRGMAGFLTGALAVAIFHQGAYFAMKQAGMALPGNPWNMAPNATAFGMPSLLNLMFWGGLWGVGYALLIDHIPGRYGWLKGFIYGSLGAMLLGSWIIVSLVKGRPMFNGFFIDWSWVKLRGGFLLNGVAFGIGLGLLYPILARVFGADRTS